MKKLIVINVVGLTKNSFDDVLLPNLSKIFTKGFCSSMVPSFPAVTCSVQSSITSGYYPADHGIISNGFYDRDTKQVSFWEQYDSLVQKPRIWDILKKANPKLKTAVLFWQNSLYTNSDFVITPKPLHLEDTTIMWCYSKPVNYYEEIAQHIGEFDLKWYWGPFASIKSSRWIIDASMYTIKKHSPDLVLVYLPHLDYSAQKHGPQSNEFKQSLVEIDNMIGDLLDFLDTNKFGDTYEIMIHSEYGFNEMNHSLSPNILLRQNGLLSIRNILGKEYIDFENSNAFAMVDHQIAHIFIKSGYDDVVTSIFKKEKNIARILDKESQIKLNINHPRSGELILYSKDNCWFNYYWWEDENHAPSFTFSVDIHRKPGYDPLELFLDPIDKRISHDTSLIKGSHGVFDSENTDRLPIFGMSIKPKKETNIIDVTQIAPTILKFFNCSYSLPSDSIL